MTTRGRLIAALTVLVLAGLLWAYQRYYGLTARPADLPPADRTRPGLRRPVELKGGD